MAARQRQDATASHAANPKAESEPGSNTVKDPADWTTGEERMTGGRRFLGEHIDGGAGNAAVGERPRERSLVDAGPASHVDEVCRRLHHGELAGADHLSGLGRERRAHDDRIRGGQELAQLTRREPGVR